MLKKYFHITAISEVIKEKVKPAPVKKGMHVNEIIFYMLLFSTVMIISCIETTTEPEVAKEKTPEPKTQKG